MSPASTSTTSPTCRSSVETPTASITPALPVGSISRLALVSRPGAAQGVGLRLAAALGDGLGEIGEQHGEPQPGRDLAGEAALRRCEHESRSEEHGDHGRDDFGDEDDRVAWQRRGSSFSRRRKQRR